MICGTSQRTKDVKLDIQINDTPIEQVKSAGYLGTDMDENLKWSYHINKMVNKISSKLGVLRKLKYIVPKDTLLLLYNTIVLSHFDNADIVYETANFTDLDRMQKLQTKAARILTGSGIRTNHEAMFKSLNWLSLKNRRLYNKCLLIYKCLNDFIS